MMVTVSLFIYGPGGSRSLADIFIIVEILRFRDASRLDISVHNSFLVLIDRLTSLDRLFTNKLKLWITKCEIPNSGYEQQV